MGTGAKQPRWKISFHRNSPPPKPQPPSEFICPISNSLMSDPVILSSGHTFDRNCILACSSLSFSPTATTADFSIVIPNLALKSTILNWCKHNSLPPPAPIDLVAAHKLVRKLIPLTESTPTRTESMTRPACYESSSNSSCEIEVSGVEENELVGRLRSDQIFEQEEALVMIRRVTRTREESRVGLCSPRLLAALKVLISSRYSNLQVNAVAVLVNLSLEKQNKVKIVRSGIVLPLIDVLKGGNSEAQDHAAGALFSLSVDDQNKTALGVLGALPPLLHAMRSGSDRTRNDSALALYHLSLVQSNRVKMIKLGSVQIFLGMVKTGQMPGRVMIVLCNFAASVEGRAAMLDGGAVECLVGLLSRDEFDSVATREGCLSALYGLSYGGLRFKGLAKEAGAEEVLVKVEETGSERAREKARRIVEVLREKGEEEEEIDWEELLNEESDVSRTMSRRLSARTTTDSC